MQKIPKIFLVLGIMAVVLIIGALIGILAGGHAAKTRHEPTPPTATADTHATATIPAPPRSVQPAPNTKPETAATELIPATEGATGIVTNWEEKVDEILGAETDETNKVQRLFALFPHVPDDGKAEVAQHLSNLTADAAYASLAELLKNPALPDDTLDTLLADALNRPNSLKLPALLDVAQTPNHPKADEAKDILALFLDEDYDTDWAKWHEKMAAWLKDNPD